MEIGDYIAIGIEQVGTATALAKLLDQSDSVLRAARRGERGLPTYACITLAKIIKAEPLEIIAASELITEKREERRAIFLPFVQMGKHAHPMLIAGFAGLIALAEITGKTVDYIIYNI